MTEAAPGDDVLVGVGDHWIGEDSGPGTVAMVFDRDGRDHEALPYGEVVSMVVMLDSGRWLAVDASGGLEWREATRH